MFRVGLLFSTPTPNPGEIAAVTRLLDEIGSRSSGQRLPRALTLMPFVRTGAMAVFAQAAAGTCVVDAAAFDEAGVVFGELSGFIYANHPPFEDGLDFDLGLKVVLPRCDVIVIACGDGVGLADARARIGALKNVAALFALIRLDGGKAEFFVVDPDPIQVDQPRWLVGIAERWNDTTARYELSAKTTRLGLLFPYLSSLMIRRWSETVKPKAASTIERCRNGMAYGVVANATLAATDRDGLDKVAKALCPYFIGHDALGRHYADVFRTTCLLVPLLIGVSTILAVASALVHSLHQGGHIAEGVLLVLAVVFYARASRGHYHERWVEHRLLTELIRPTLLHALFYLGPSLAPPHERSARWIDRSRLVLAHLRALPTTHLVTPKSNLLSARISAIADFATDQARWHHDFADQHHAAEKTLAAWSTRAFVATLVFCVFQLGVSWLSSNTGHGPGEGLPISADALDAVTLLTLTVATSAFFVSLLAHQLGFAAIAERSANAAAQFSTLSDSIQQHRHDADARRAYEWADQCANTILMEQLSWYRQIPVIQFHL